MIGVLASAFALVRVFQLTVLLVFIGGALYYYRDEIADRLDLEPGVDVIEHTRPGLTDREVEEFHVLHQEYLKIRDEKRKEQERKYRNQGKSGGSLNTK